MLKALLTQSNRNSMNERIKELSLQSGGMTMGQELKIVASGVGVGRSIKMNERIRELAKQAGMTDDKFGMFFANDKHNEDGVDLQKFAELIVRECINQCEEVAVGVDKVSKSKFVTDAGRMLHEGMWGGAKNCSGRIKQHFGVEDNYDSSCPLCGEDSGTTCGIPGCQY